jgi:hypothetical protein
VASVGGVEQFGEAVIAGGDVRGDERPPPVSLPALFDPEPSISNRSEGLPIYGLDRS